jgi:hypothetical protein
MEPHSGTCVWCAAFGGGSVVRGVPAEAEAVCSVLPPAEVLTPLTRPQPRSREVSRQLAAQNGFWTLDFGFSLHRNGWWVWAVGAGASGLSNRFGHCRRGGVWPCGDALQSAASPLAGWGLARWETGFPVSAMSCSQLTTQRRR